MDSSSSRQHTQCACAATISLPAKCQPMNRGPPQQCTTVFTCNAFHVVVCNECSLYSRRHRSRCRHIIVRRSPNQAPASFIAFVFFSFLAIFSFFRNFFCFDSSSSSPELAPAFRFSWRAVPPERVQVRACNSKMQQAINKL